MLRRYFVVRVAKKWLFLVHSQMVGCMHIWKTTSDREPCSSAGSTHTPARWELSTSSSTWSCVLETEFRKHQENYLCATPVKRELFVRHPDRNEKKEIHRHQRNTLKYYQVPVYGRVVAARH